MTAFKPQNKMAVASTHFFLSDEYFLAGLCGSFEPPLAPPVIQRKSMVKNLHHEKYRLHFVRCMYLFLHQLTHSITTDCSLNYEFRTRKLQVQFIKLFFIHFSQQFDVQKLVVFLYWTHNSGNNLSSHLGLIDARKSSSNKDLMVKKSW